MALGSKKPGFAIAQSGEKTVAGATFGLWEEVPSVWTPRAVALTIYGDSDTGRSTLALTAPGPIAYLHGHEKVDAILERKRSEGVLIRQHKFGGNMRGTAEEIQKRAQEEIKSYEAAKSNAYTWARTIIDDTETRLWELYQLARLGSMVRAERDGKDNKQGQLIYTEINAAWGAMMQEYKDRLENPVQQDPETGNPIYTNLILICKTKDEYKKDAQTGKTGSTGRTIIASQKNTWFFSDMVIRTQRKRDRFTGIIEKPWWNADYRDYELKGDDGELDFTYIMSMVTESDTSYWG